MQSSNQILETDLPQPGTDDNNFAKNRKKIKRFFENTHLKKTICEFYKVQHGFHQNMAHMVNAFSNINKETLEDSRYLLAELLLPYRILSVNIFKRPNDNEDTEIDEKDIDVERDIAHILKVINIRNEAFQTALIALLNSIANLGAFTNLIKQCQEDTELAAIIKKEFKTASWLAIQSHVDRPFQNLMRYEILLKAIQESLIKAGCERTEDMFENLSNAIQFILPEIKNINDSREIILLLNKIERVVGNVLADVTRNDKFFNLETSTTEIKEHIEFVLVSVKTGKTKIIQGEQNVISLFEGLLELLKGIQQSLTPNTNTLLSYATSASQYVSSFLFNSAGEGFKRIDPLADLKAIINELNTTVEQTEALKNVQEKLLKRRT